MVEAHQFRQQDNVKVFFFQVLEAAEV